MDSREVADIFCQNGGDALADHQSEFLLVEPPPFDIDSLQRIDPPWRAVKEWIPDDEPNLDWFNRSSNPSNPNPDGFNQTSTWKLKESIWKTVASWFSIRPDTQDAHN